MVKNAFIKVIFKKNAVFCDFVLHFLNFGTIFDSMT